MKSTTVVLYPISGISHLGPMVDLAKLMKSHHPALSVVVFITPAPFGTPSTEKYISTISATTPFITFHHLPTVAIPPDFYSEYVDVAFGIPELYSPIIHNTLATISEKSTIKAFIIDIFSNAAFPVAKSLNIPTYYFIPSGVTALCEFLYLTTIHNTTSNNIKDENIYLDIPGAPPIHASDIRKHFLDRESNSYKFLTKTGSNMAKSSGFIVNSFVGFEQRAVDALRDDKGIPDGPTPPVYVVGPLTTGGSQMDHSQNECLEWLNSQPCKSVVFVCFGSMGVFKKEQLKEIAIGLERSGQRFLWVVRKPPSDDEKEIKEFDLDDILPEGFLTRTGDKGLVVKNWAPQQEILNHESVGGFVFHCGWNSILESVVAGVPMVGWPMYGDQKMHRVLISQEMKLALAVKMSSDGFVTADEVDEKVRELMEGEEGRMVRERMLEMRARAKAAVEDGGSCGVEFLKLIQSWTTT